MKYPLGSNLIFIQIYHFWFLRCWLDGLLIIDLVLAWLDEFLFVHFPFACLGYVFLNFNTFWGYIIPTFSRVWEMSGTYFLVLEMTLCSPFSYIIYINIYIYMDKLYASYESQVHNLTLHLIIMRRGSVSWIIAHWQCCASYKYIILSLSLN